MTKKAIAAEKKHQHEIALARANGYEGVIIPLEVDYDLQYIEDAKDKEYIYDIAYEYGWDKFVVVLFKSRSNISKYIDLKLTEAA